MTVTAKNTQESSRDTLLRELRAYSLTVAGQTCVKLCRFKTGRENTVKIVYIRLMGCAVRIFFVQHFISCFVFLILMIIT
jgi:hypothetical protein